MAIESRTSSKSFFSLISATVAAVVLSGMTPVAEGAQATAKPQVLEEVVVTARRQEENQQQVPMSVTALTPELMEQQNITKYTDLMFTVPSMTHSVSFSSLLSGFTLRGLPGGVTTYIAEAACCAGNPSMTMLDVQSVQVLSGAQGTLFGRNSYAGAVLVEPMRPNMNETEGSLKLGLGDYDRQEITGAVSVPIMEDRLAIRLAASALEVDGYTDMIGSSDQYDEVNNQQLRLGVQFNNGRFSNYTAIGYMSVDQSSTSNLLTSINLTDTGVIGAFPFNLNPAFAPFVYGAPCADAVTIGLNSDVDSCVAERVGIVTSIQDALIAENNRVQSGGTIRKMPAPKPGTGNFVKLEDWNIINVAKFDDIDFGRVQASVKHVFSFESQEDLNLSSNDGVGGLLLGPLAFTTGTTGGPSAGNNNSLNGELLARLGPATEIINNDLNVTFDVDDGLLVTTLGFYYSRSEAPSSNKGTNNFAQYYSGVLNPDLGFYSLGNFNKATERVQRAWYTQSTLDASTFAIEGLSFTVGYRKSWDKDNVEGFPAVFDLATGSYSPGTTLSQTQSKSDDHNYLFTVTQQFTDNFMAYVSKTRAYTPGGVNRIVVAGIEGLPNYKPTFDPQIVEAWEVGSKIDFYLGQNIPVRLNAAAFFYDFSDIGVLLSGTTTTGEFASYTTNAANAELTGFELSGAIIPIEGLEISFAYNYNDSKYKNWDGGDPFSLAQPGDAICGPVSTPTTCVLDLSSNPFARMPEHQGHVTVAYSLPLDETLGRVTLSANLYAQSLVWFSPNATRDIQVLPTAKPVISQESYSTLNLRANWDNVMDSGFDAALFVNNATDEIYAQQKIQQLMSLGISTAIYAPPRMWGFEVSRRF